MSNYIVITGATGGLGEALMKQYAKPGNFLRLIARNEEKLQYLKNQFERFCDDIDYFVADLSDRSQDEPIVKWIGENIDVIIHNAGFGLFHEAIGFNLSIIQNMFAVNVDAPIHLTTRLLPILYQKKAGSIVFIVSQASKIVTPKSSVYSATKFALRGYANGLRLEAKSQGVHILVVNPGPIRTAFFERADQTGSYVQNVKQWLLESDDVAKAIVDGIKKHKREVNLPLSMEFLSRVSVLFPKISDHFIAKFGNKK